MKFSYILLFLAALIWVSCKPKSATSTETRLVGTWQLVSGTTLAKGVSTTIDYTKNQRMIKIINGTHFAFLRHDVQAEKDSSNHFDAGGGRYTLTGNQYTEYLDYYTDTKWEHKKFSFTITLNKDTLVQKGIEKVEGTAIDRVIIEKYVKLK